MHKILITGGSGFIGSRLTDMLVRSGYDVVHLGRSRHEGAVRSFVWDPKRMQMEEDAFDGVETIIHLAGANVGSKPWTAARKREILDSRVQSSRLLFDRLKHLRHNVSSVVSASAIGYYGFADENTVYKEDDAGGTDFLAGVVKQWEEEVSRIATLGIRVAMIRVGIVLSNEEGALPEMARPIRLYAGAPLGSGDQKLSWIHVDDVCRVFKYAVEKREIDGPVNAVAPDPVTNRDLTKAIAAVLGKPLILPKVPAFALKILFGEMADLVLKGNTVSNEKLRRYGFSYNFPTLDKALRDLL